MIGRLLPAGVAVAESFGEPIEHPLHPVEEPAVRDAVLTRRLEFADARACARQALTLLNVPPAGIPRSADRSPVWPEGIVGSITHTLGYRGVAVARGEEWATIGIDADTAEPLPADVLDIVCAGEERQQLAALGDDLPWDKLIFSAKESVYKAWYPITGRWLGFEDVWVVLDAGAQTFRADLLVCDPPTLLASGRVDGRWTIADGLVLTAIAVPRPGRG